MESNKIYVNNFKVFFLVYNFFICIFKHNIIYYINEYNIILITRLVFSDKLPILFL